MKILLLSQIKIHGPKIISYFKGYTVILPGMESARMKTAQLCRLEVDPNPIIGINSRLFFIGSCFSENIGTRLAQLGFFTQVNPYGIIYNPESMAVALQKIASSYQYIEADLHFHHGSFLSLNHHGSFHHPEADTLLQRINDTNKQANEYLKHTDIGLITVGTSFVYKHILRAEVVANCHKIPAGEFEKYMLSEAEIIRSLSDCVHHLRHIRPGMKIILTLSPVKHLRDGLIENAASKARLLSAIHAFMQAKLPDVFYFPASEIVTEELRDYRYYAEDLAHPSPWTIMYIFHRFCETFFDARAMEFLDPAIKYARMLNHRVMSQDIEEINKWETEKQRALGQLKERFSEKEWP